MKNSILIGIFFAISFTLFFFSSFSQTIAQSQYQVLSECEIVKLFEDENFQGSKSVMVCIAYYESRFNTHACNENTNLSWDYGLYQCNNNYWCTEPGFTADSCGVKCEDLFIPEESVKCTIKVYNSMGFDAWNAYKSHKDECDNWVLPKCPPVPCASKRKFKYYNRCEGDWKDDILGTGTSTICEQGTVVSTMAMVLNQLEILIEGEIITPKNLNQWLIDNGGYSTDLFVWNSIENIDSAKPLPFVGSITDVQKIKEHVCNNDIAIIKVNGNFLLAISANDKDEFVVLNAIDKSEDTFRFSDVEVARIYDALEWKVSLFKNGKIVLAVTMPIFGVVLCIILGVVIVLVCVTSKKKEPFIKVSSEALKNEDHPSRCEIEEDFSFSKTEL